MTVNDFLLKNTRLLQRHGINTARLDCLVLLQDVLNTNSAHILGHPEINLSDEQEQLLQSYIIRRSTSEPLAYIRRESEFYGYKFYIDRNVLVPRPESEMIIDLLKDIALSPQSTIVDIGTGSGALAITACIKFPAAKVIATDIDERCIALASRNAEQLGVKIDFFNGNLLDPIRNQKFKSLIFICNLPYVPNDLAINKAATYEPRRALFGGNDGLAVYREFFLQLHDLYEKTPTTILTESLPFQHVALAELAKVSGFRLQTTKDFIQLFERT